MGIRSKSMIDPNDLQDPENLSPAAIALLLLAALAIVALVSQWG